MKTRYEEILEKIGKPYLEFEISVCQADVSLEDVIAAVEDKYPDYKFSRTEPRYSSCIMAIFEPRLY